MPQLLFVDACVRGAESRSRMLAERFLSSYAAANPDAAILRRDLMRDRLEPQYPEVLACRDALAAAGKLDDPLFADAWQFARADRIVLAAPFWELSFPAILKIYLERVSMRDITFGYEESGLVGRCRAEKLLLVTTRGGDYSLPETGWMEMGARQLKALCAMFGIPKAALCRGAGRRARGRASADGRGPCPRRRAGKDLLTRKRRRLRPSPLPYYSSSESCSRSSPLGSMPNSLGRKRGQTFSDVQMTDAASRVPISQASAIVLP